MALPYFPMFPSDFEADTSHLSLEEDGAYNRLLRLMWMAPGCSLPADDAWLSRRMRVDAETFSRVVRPVLDEFFRVTNGRIINPRLSEEFKKVDKTSKARSEAGKKGGRPKVVDNKEKEEKPGFDFDKGGLSYARALPEPEPEPYKSDDDDRPRSADFEGGDQFDRRIETIREIILDAMGVDPSGVVGGSRFIGGQGDMAEAKRWLSLPGLNLRIVSEEVRRVMAQRRDPDPPSSFRYFSRAMEKLSGQITAPDLKPEMRKTSNGKSSTALAADAAINSAAASLPDDYFRDPANRDRL